MALKPVSVGEEGLTREVGKIRRNEMVDQQDNIDPACICRQGRSVR